MIQIYKSKEETNNAPIEVLKTIEENCWIHLEKPTIEEIRLVHEKTDIDIDLLLKLLDEKELPRIEKSGNATMIVIDIPYHMDKRYKNRYTTYPLGIVTSDNGYFVTISMKKCPILEAFQRGEVKDFSTYLKTRFTIQLLLHTSVLYLRYLVQINEDAIASEQVLLKKPQNKDLVDLLNLQNSLVYFISSLKGNDIILEKLSKGTIIPMYEDDMDLLEDAMIENKQGIELAHIYREILSSVSDTYANVISNNLNMVMKLLAGMTIVISIPTMISSFLGMNVPLGKLATDTWAVAHIFLLSIIASCLVAIWLKKKDML